MAAILSQGLGVCLASGSSQMETSTLIYKTTESVWIIAVSARSGMREEASTRSAHGNLGVARMVLPLNVSGDAS